MLPRHSEGPWRHSTPSSVVVLRGLGELWVVVMAGRGVDLLADVGQGEVDLVGDALHDGEDELAHGVLRAGGQ